MFPNQLPKRGDSDNNLLFKIAQSSTAQEEALTGGSSNTLTGDRNRNSFVRDAFFRSRVSLPETIFDFKQVVDYSPNYWSNVEASGGGTSSAYSSDRASTTLSVSNLTAGRRVRQSNAYHNYKPGSSQLVYTTFVFGSPVTGITRRVGIFDDRNGFFLEQTGAGARLVTRSHVTGTPVDLPVEQASWNTDKLDGTGTSGVTLDLSKSQLFFIDFTWLGTGSIRFGFVIDGIPIQAHIFHTANRLTSVSISNPNAPIRFEIINSGAGPAASLESICSAVIVEGGAQRIGASYAMDRDTTPLVTLNDASIYPVLGIRFLSTTGAKTITTIPTGFSVVTPTANTYRWMLVKNPTFVGTAPTYTARSPAVEGFSTTTNATTITGGRILRSGYGLQTTQSGAAPAVFDLPPAERVGSTYAGVSDVFVLAVQRIVGTTESYYVSLFWDEIP